MSKRSDQDSLHDIHEAAQRIRAYVAEMSYAAFLQDTKTQDAVIRNIEIIGEATKNLSADIRDRYAVIPWKSLAGMRDRLIHRYFGVNLDIVWSVSTSDLTQLIPAIAKIIDEQD